MSDLCDQCGIGKFEIEQVGAETTRTCTNCGYSCNYLELTSPNTNDGYTDSNSISLSKKYKTGVGPPAIRPNRLIAIKQIHAYLDKYPKNLCLHQTAEQLFIKSWEAVRVGKLATFAAATLVIVLREAGQSVFMDEISDFFGVRPGDVSKKMLYIRCYYDVSVPMTSVEHFVTKHLNNCYCIGDKDKVKKLALSLCQLFERVNLGASPKSTALLAIYNATIAVAAKVPAMTITDFFRKTAFKSPFPGFDRSSALVKTKLIILAKRLPWATKVSKRNYHTFISAIIKHQSIIFHKDVNGAVSKKLPTPCANSEHGESSDCIGGEISEQIQLEMPAVCLKQILNPRLVIPEEDDPISVSNSEVLMEDDCPEEELKEYIRTDEEVNIYLKLKASLPEE